VGPKNQRLFMGSGSTGIFPLALNEASYSTSDYMITQQRRYLLTKW
jgi:hypothetical protein